MPKEADVRGVRCCPILVGAGGASLCGEGHCAWWVAETDECSIVMIGTAAALMVQERYQRAVGQGGGE